MSVENSAKLPKCVLCGFAEGHDEWCDRNPAKGQPIEYQLARVACAIPVPKGFGQCVDGTDGARVGTNVATVEEWRQFFVTFLSQGVLPISSVTDKMVEAAAFAQHEKDAEIFGTDKWHELDNETRSRLRPGIRAGLEAALGNAEQALREPSVEDAIRNAFDIVQRIHDAGGRIEVTDAMVERAMKRLGLFLSADGHIDDAKATREILEAALNG